MTAVTAVCKGSGYPEKCLEVLKPQLFRVNAATKIHITIILKGKLI